MLDAYMRRRIDPALDRVGARLAAIGVRADAVTLVGFAVGLLAVPLAAMGWHLAALIALLANRLADGLDGAVARHDRLTDLGGYLDIVCDFLIYAGLPVGFALFDPTANALAAAVLLFSFMGTGSSFLTYAIIAAKRGETTEIRGRKSLYYLGGLTEGTETFAFLAAICVFPQAFVPLAYVFAAACWVTTVSRILAAVRAFGERAGS
ncbi:CDP-alcohol phosphatidyltransferase family protein [Rhodovibrio salinarum]|uniref:CDP-alcohol phosphatidyltransferase n=1 Tax=Rhodovibrio salinarum TaxID=1087 RepID=A0A934V0M7_9PROT|nr:CDP-alcohol phosphatidyltransferase family protein [Rhodovibrio salinarum]MBK1698427.1 CDP-alcohol phosphatidyltransferase [Rhodovibrio salinarum]